MPLAVPAQTEVARKNKELGLPSRIGNRSPEWQWLTDKEGKACENRTEEGPRTGVRTSGRTSSSPG